MKPRVKAMRLASIDGNPTENQFEEITLAEQARRALRRDITSGALQAGQTLKLEFLKERYGISFSPIREALTSLESERLVVSNTSKGFRVAPLSEEEMWDAIETRILIDCQALRRSIKNGDDEWEVQLVSAFHSLKLVAKSNSSQASSEEREELLETKHQEFHRRLISACGSIWLKQLSSQLYAQTERYRRPNLRGRSSLHNPGPYSERDVNQEHSNLLAAAIARNAELASELLEKHYRETGRMIVEAIKQTSSNEAARLQDSTPV